MKKALLHRTFTIQPRFPHPFFSLNFILDPAACSALPEIENGYLAFVTYNEYTSAFVAVGWRGEVLGGVWLCWLGLRGQDVVGLVWVGIWGRVEGGRSGRVEVVGSFCVLLLCGARLWISVGISNALDTVLILPVF